MDNLPLIPMLIVIAGLLAVVLFGLHHLCVQDQCHTPPIPWDDE